MTDRLVFSNHSLNSWTPEGHSHEIVRQQSQIRTRESDSVSICADLGRKRPIPRATTVDCACPYPIPVLLTQTVRWRQRPVSGRSHLSLLPQSGDLLSYCRFLRHPLRPAQEPPIKTSSAVRLPTQRRHYPGWGVTPWRSPPSSSYSPKLRRGVASSDTRRCPVSFLKE